MKFLFYLAPMLLPTGVPEWRWGWQMITHSLHGVSREKNGIFSIFCILFIPNPCRRSIVAQLSLKSEKVIFDEFVLCFDRDLSLFPFFSFLFWKGIWSFGLLQVPETGKFGREVNGRLIGSIGEYRARFLWVDRYHVASRRMRNRRLYLY